MNKDITDEEYSSAQFKHILYLSRLKYNNELKREESLLKQASNMQTAFAFTTAAIFAALPICIDNRGKLSYLFFYIWIAIIVLLMIGSLIFASLAQWRFKTMSLGSIDEIEKSVLDDEQWKEYIKESYRDKQIIDLVNLLDNEKYKLNNKRVNYIVCSMICFFLAISAIILCFINATYLLWFR